LNEQLPDTFVGAIASNLRQPTRNLKRLRRLTSFSEDIGDPEDVIWALKDISFEVERGEVIGIIGRNGAGKSTLLKILSRITYPTSGRVELYGRVSSLLEVGTGFHPELTGRENIYLNGTILGMTRREIARKFDEIVNFSGVEKFIDTPVKRYSSGMGVRLAFSVAAHLEPEILLVDEVLSVGDAEFQRKCFVRIKELYLSGISVLLVSHYLIPVMQLSKKVMWAENGRIKRFGDPKAVCERYSSELQSENNVTYADRSGDGRVTIEHAFITDSQEKHISSVKPDQGIIFSIVGKVNEQVPNFMLGIRIRAFDGTVITGFLVNSESLGIRGFPGNFEVKCKVQQLQLRDGEYFVTVIVTDDELALAHDVVEQALRFRVESSAITFKFDYIEPNIRLTHWGAHNASHRWYVATPNTERGKVA